MKASELASIRAEMGMTQTALADRLGLDNAKGHARRTISDWERGRRVIPGPVALALSLLLENERRPK